MKRIIQSLDSGKTSIESTPMPKVGHGEVLIKTKYSLISKGTEKMLVEFGKASPISKARQQPDKVNDVINKLLTDGIKPTIEAVYNKLQYPLPMGYCNLGVVIGVGEGVTSFDIGDTVISNGSHSEVVSVPANLCCKIPSGIDHEQAVFTILASISLQGIRLAKPTLGEYFVVYGLGIVGLMTVQLLRSNGCRVLGIDYDKEKIKIAKQYGADTFCLSNSGDILKYANNFSRKRGVDGVIIAASSKDNQIINNAARMCRKRGRIILVGVTGLDISRTEFFKKEITFQVSCSYGPGRYDSNYEKKGLDYPISYVRWTQNRNFEAILDLIDDMKINLKDLISHIFEFDKAIEAYDLILNDNSCLGILLKYKIDNEDEFYDTKILRKNVSDKKNTFPDNHSISFIGSGNYARQTLIPAFKKSNILLNYITSIGGLSSTVSGQKYGFLKSTTDVELVLNDPSTQAVVISTRHDSHCDLIIKSLEHGKDVYVEKPMCINLNELEEIKKCFRNLKANGKSPVLMVGFNRRFSPHIIKIRDLLSSVNDSKSIVITVNAGFLPDDHWTKDRNIGGGRIIGEVCHFIDLLLAIVGSPIVSWKRNSINEGQEDVSIILNFKDGSFGTINYFTGGAKSFPKENIEIFCNGSVLKLNNFKSLKGYGWKKFKKLNLWQQDKGHRGSVQAFLDAIKNRNMPISFENLVETTKTSINIADSTKSI
jgi:predicted dehydrogenase/threonine dehydrogenase-like Zn-dependent dehydrogenase